MVSLDEYLTQVYYTTHHPAGFSGINKLYQHAKQRFPRVSLNRIKSWLLRQPVYRRHKFIRRKFLRVPVIGYYRDHLWQADLADVKNLKTDNDNIKFILVVVDALSRYAFAEPVRNKT